MHKSVNTHEIQSNRKWKFHLSVENCKKELNSTRINSEKGSINSRTTTRNVLKSSCVMCMRSMYVVRVLFVETWYSRSEIWISKNFEQFFNFEPNGFLKIHIIIVSTRFFFIISHIHRNSLRSMNYYYYHLWKVKRNHRQQQSIRCWCT